MSIEIQSETFQTIRTEPLGYKPGDLEFGTVQVKLSGRTVTVEARRFDDATIYCRGFIGRYRTSSKAWRAQLWTNGRGETCADFGRDDRSGRFQKLAGISYDPEAYKAAK